MDVFCASRFTQVSRTSFSSVWQGCNSVSTVDFENAFHSLLKYKKSYGTAVTNPVGYGTSFLQSVSPACS